MGLLPYRVAEPNEALLITGARAQKGKQSDVGGEEGTGFKIVVGRGTLVIPFFQKVNSLSLEANQALISEHCVTTQGIAVDLEGVVVYKVGDDLVSIANASRRFLGKEDQMEQQCRNIFAGHLRAITGAMTVQDIIRERTKLAQAVREACSDELQKLGLVVDSFQIQKLGDPTGFIDQLSAPHQASVRSEARIAEAERDQEAVQKEQEAAAIKAKATADSEVKQAELSAIASEAAAKAAQAGPLAAATAQQQVVVQQTRVVELQAAQKQQQLEVDIVKPAQAQRDANIAAAEAEQQTTILAAEGQAKKTKLAADSEASATKVIADADAEKARKIGEADGAAIKAKLIAEADGLKARAEALAANQDAVIGQQIAEKLPEIVRAGAESMKGIDSFIVLDGMEGVENTFAKAIGMGLAVLPQIQKALSHNGNGNSNGTKTQEADERVLETTER